MLWMWTAELMPTHVRYFEGIVVVFVSITPQDVFKFCKEKISEEKHE